MAAGDEAIEKAGDAAGTVETSGAGEAAPGVPGERSALTEELFSGTTAPTLVAVVIAWATTLVPSGFARGASVTAGLLSVLALGAGLTGPLLARRNARAGRHLGISLFAALATATWLAGSAAIHPLRLDPIRGAFGAIAWGVFALSWSERWGPRAEALPPDPDAPLLLPRAALPPGAVPLTTAAVAASIVYLVVAFGVRDPDRALVAQALALACGVGVVSAAGIVATARGKRRSSGGRRLTPTVVRALLLLVAVAVGGAVAMTLWR